MIYDNTLIIFTSDNGPTSNGGVDADWFGSGMPFKEGAGYRMARVYEGGIREPMIAVWPGHIEPGSRTDLISIQYDVMDPRGPHWV